MATGDVTIIAPGSIQGDDTKTFARAKSISNGFGVMSTTDRDLIHADVKAGGYAVYNTTTSQLERWNGAAWVAISAGGAGGGAGFRFTYSTTTADADPGAGTLRGNNATLSSVTTLYVDLAEYGATDVTAWLDSFDDYAGSIKGIVRLSSQSDPTKWIEYTMTAWTTAVGYRKLTVVYKNGPGGLLTTAGDTFFAFDYASAGISGGTSITVSAAGAVARAALTGDVTASADSNATAIAANAVTTAKILDANVTLAKVADGSACSVLGRSANTAGVHASIASTADGEVFRRAGGVLGWGTIATAGLANVSVTGPKLVAGTAAGQQLLWDGTQYLLVGTLTGTALTNADATLQFSTAPQYIWPSAVDATVARNLTLGTTGLAAGPMAGQGAVLQILFLRASNTALINVKNNAAATIFTLPAALGKTVRANFYYDTTAADWALSGWEYLGTVTVA